MWIMHDNAGWGWMVFGGLWMIVFWGLVIGFLVWAISRLARPRETSGSGGSALAILKERYARSEITKEQFDAMKRDIA